MVLLKKASKVKINEIILVLCLVWLKTYETTVGIVVSEILILNKSVFTMPFLFFLINICATLF